MKAVRGSRPAGKHTGRREASAGHRPGLSATGSGASGLLSGESMVSGISAGEGGRRQGWCNLAHTMGDVNAVLMFWQGLGQKSCMRWLYFTKQAVLCISVDAGRSSLSLTPGSTPGLDSFRRN
jgi:hypothetical protein